MGRKLPKGATCYACEKPATSREHAPPQGFYPKGLWRHPGRVPIDYRQRLIWVPSCEDHNNAKSRDDHYAMTVIGVVAVMVGDALEALDPHPFALELIERARRGRRLQAAVKDAKRSQSADGEYAALEVDQGSLYEVIETTAKALYFYEHKGGARWPGHCHVHSRHLRMPDLSPSPHAEKLERIETRLNQARAQGLAGWEWRGPHPDVFAYQLVELQPGQPLLRLAFYGVFTFLVWADATPQLDRQHRADVPSG